MSKKEKRAPHSKMRIPVDITSSGCVNERACKVTVQHQEVQQQTINQIRICGTQEHYVLKKHGTENDWSPYSSSSLRKSISK